MRIKFDPKKCTGCMACQMACMDQNDQVTPPLRRVVLQETERSALYYSIGCIHCGKCLEACPQNAIYRDENGFVQIIREKCVGCGNCAKACPLSAIAVTADGAKKCSGCSERIQVGLLPACVHTCPTGALMFED